MRLPQRATTRTLLCGDLFTHGGADGPPITESEVLGPSEAIRQAMPAGSVAIERGTRAILEKLAATEPRTLALMHGSSYRGDGAKLLRGLADALDAEGRPGWRMGAVASGRPRKRAAQLLFSGFSVIPPGNLETLEASTDAELVRRAAVRGDGARAVEAELCRRFAPRVRL